MIRVFVPATLGRMPEVWSSAVAQRPETTTPAVAALATGQFGVASGTQLAGLGIAARRKRRWVQAGLLHRLYGDVYAVGHAHVPLRGRWLAAVLACGPGAVLSHRDAAELWGLRSSGAAAPIDVTVTRKRAPREGLRLHRTRALAAQEVAAVEGIAVTSVARTLVDLAGVVRADALAKAVDRAEILRVFDGRAVEAALARGAGRRGTAALRAVIATERSFTRSELERYFLALAEGHGLPWPRTNVRLLGHEIDALWEAQRLVVEVDSWAFHGTRRAFERDRAKDAALQVAGFRVLRVTHRRLRRDAKGVAADVRALLRASGG